MSNNEINRVPELIPQDIANSSADFLNFIRKYYEFLNQDGMPSDEVARSLHKRNLDLAVDNYLDQLYIELGYGYVLNKDANRANILSNLGSIYSAKGSLDSVKVLFRVMFGEEVNIRLPKDVILQPSHGNWLSEYSVMAVVKEGDPLDMIGKFVEVQTTFADTPTQTFDVEVKRVELRDVELGVYEIYTSRYFLGFFSDVSTITYRDVELDLIKTMSAVLGNGIEVPGSGFRVGDVYDVKSYERGNAYNDLLGIPTSVTRKAPSNSAFRDIDVENVDIDVRTDGTLTEVITKETDKGTVKICNIIRGNTKVTTTQFLDGTSTETTEQIKGNPAPNLQVDWDAIAEAMIELANFGTDQEVQRAYSLSIALDGTRQYADFNDNGSIDIEDAVAALHYSNGSFSLISVDVKNNIDSMRAEYLTRYGVAMNVNLKYALTLLGLSLQEDFDPDNFVSNHLLSAVAGTERQVGDIDDDGVIDSGDISLMAQYTDPILNPLMDSGAKLWITSIIYQPLNSAGNTAWDALTEAEKDAEVLRSFAINYSASNRNQLHDFLLQEDVDYPGFVRADINQDGIVSNTDVQLLLRRASGIDIASGSITDIIYGELVGGYQFVDPEIVDPNAEGAIITPTLGDGVMTTLRIANPGLGLRAAEIFIYDRGRVKPSNWDGTVRATLDIRDGKIRDVDLLEIGAGYNPDSAQVEFRYYTQDEARIYPIVSGGAITGFDIQDGGTGYMNSSDIVLSRTSGSGFLGDIVVKDGVIEDFTIANAGAGYTNPQVNITSTTGTGADVDAILDSNGSIIGFAINDGGESYNDSDFEENNIANNTVTITELSGTPPTEEANISQIFTTDGVISDVNIYDGGTGYDQPPVSKVDRVTQVPELVPVIQNGVLLDLKVTDGGLGYSEATSTVELNARRSDVEFTYTLDGSGSFTSIEVSNGFGYKSNAQLVITDPDKVSGDDILVDLFVSNGVITQAVIIDGGSGFVNPVLTVADTDRLDADVSVEIDVDHLTWIEEVIVEPLIGSVYNPVLREGSGLGGTIRIQEVDGNGGITKVKFQSFGYNYPDFFTTYIEPKNQSGIVADIAFKSNIVGVSTPTYVDRKGFLSDIIKVQDNNFYQQFSYVVETGVSFYQFENIIKKSVHPAGMKVFGEQTITDKFEVDSSIDEAYSVFINRYFSDVTDHSDNDDWHLFKESESTHDYPEAISNKETYTMHKPKQDYADVQSNTDDVWYFEKDLTVNGYREFTNVTNSKETYHMFKESDSTKDTATTSVSKETWLLEKPLYDTAINSDNDDWHFIKALDDDADAENEKETWLLEKPLYDTAITSDDTTLADDDIYAMVKAVKDTATTSVSKETWVMGKSLNDTPDADEYLTYSIHKPLQDYYTTISDPNWHFFKPRSDQTSNSDNDYWHFFKPRSDQTTNSDLDDWHFFKPRSDQTTNSDLDDWHFFKPRSDQTSNSESVIIALGLLKFDEANVSDVDPDKAFIKRLTDTASADDDTTVADDDIYLINKSRTDTILISDSGSSTHRYIYAIGYFADPEDYAFSENNYTF